MLIMRSVLDFMTFQPACLLRFTSQHIFRRYASCNEVNPKSRAQFRMSPNVFRQKKLYTAVVQKVFDASPSIKVLRLYVKEPGFSFKAGQWVDFHIPGIDEITGYSMTSPPFEAKLNGTLDLAVKEGSFPPTNWVHSICRGGEEVTIRVGGDFYYDPEINTNEATADLLLIGGGVGINPLVSILLQYCYLVEQNEMGDTRINPGKVHLLYAAKTEKELIFKENFLNMAKLHPSITCQFFITGEKSSNPLTKSCRIEKYDIENSIKMLQKNHTLCYICGPSNMTDDMAIMLSSLQVQNDYIRYEKWW